MTDKIKILICTDSAAITSGLGNATRRSFAPMLQMFPDKYEIIQLGFFNFNPRVGVPWQIINTKVVDTPQGKQPDINDKYGEKSFDEVLPQINPDIVLGFGDMWHFNHLITSPYRNRYRLVTYYTIDGAPYYGHLNNDNTTMWGSNLSKVDQVVTPTHFGKDTLLKSCPELNDEAIKVVYHPLVMNDYPEYTDDQLFQMRQQFLPNVVGKDKDSFICGFVGRNQFRKQNYKLWELTHYIVHGDYIECEDCGRITLKEWDHSARKSKDPQELTQYEQGYDYSHCWHCKSSNIRAGTPNDKFYMWIHSPKGDQGYNFDLHQRLWEVQPKCIYTSSESQNVSEQQIAQLMSTWDAMYYPSGGEGFGMPAFESLACKTPVVYSNYSAHAEFSQHGGLPVRVSNYTPEIHHGIMRSAVDTADGVKQMLRLIRNPDLVKELGESGRDHVQQYRCENIAATWDKVFTNVMKKPLPIQSDKIYGSIV